MINEYKYLQVYTPWGKCLKDDYSLQHLALPTPGSRLNAMYVLGGCPYCNYHLSSQTKPWNVTPWKFYANCFFPNLRYIELWFTAWGGADPLVMYASRKHGSAASWHLECFMKFCFVRGFSWQPCAFSTACQMYVSLRALSNFHTCHMRGKHASEAREF